MAISKIVQDSINGGVSGSGPAFSAYLSGNQSVTTATFTVMQASVEQFDTNNCYNNTGSTATLNGLSVPAYAFMPNIAGYYQINGVFSLNSTPSGVCIISVFKNGSRFQDGTYTLGGYLGGLTTSMVVYLNGTTDYVQMTGYITGVAPQLGGGTNACLFQGAMVRAA